MGGLDWIEPSPRYTSNWDSTGKLPKPRESIDGNVARCERRCSKKSCGDECSSKLLNKLSNALKATKNGNDSLPNCERRDPSKLGNIEKRIVSGSTGRIPAGCEGPGGGLMYPNETKFYFHYRIQRVGEDGEILDDTRKYGKIMELYSGKKFQVDFWENCLATMLPGEVSSFTVPANRLLAFPAVNKKLRDYMLNKKGAAVRHCCGFMSLQEQGGLGYPDLDEFLLNPQPLVFTFDLVKVDVPELVRKDIWIMNAEEKARMVPILREEGNKFYTEADYDQAIGRYKEALGILEQLILMEKPGEPEWIELDQARVPLFFNLAQCQFKIKEFYAAIGSATEALQRDPKHVKALYRRAKSYTETWDLDLAATDWRQLAVMAPAMQQSVNAEVKALESKRAEQEIKERRLMAGKLFPGARSQQ